MSSGGVEAGVAVAALLLTVAGLAIRFGLVPYLRDQIAAPTHQIQAQLTPTEPQEDPATVPDQLEQVLAKLEENTAETLAVGRMFEGHIESADREHARLQAEVDRLWLHLRKRKG